MPLQFIRDVLPKVSIKTVPKVRTPQELERSVISLLRLLLFLKRKQCRLFLRTEQEMLIAGPASPRPAMLDLHSFE